MKRIRIRIIILTSWLILFLIISRLLNPVAVSNITLELVFSMAVLTLAIPPMSKFPYWALMIVSMIMLWVSKFITGDLASNIAIFLAVSEACAIAVTSFLSRWVSIGLYEFETAVTAITLGQREKRLENAISGEGSIYREVRRARNHQRPLAIISIGVDEKSLVPSAEKIVLEIQQSMMKQFKLQELSKMLCTELEDCAVIVQDTDHYLAVLPDTMPEEIPVVVERLRQKAFGEVGVEIKIGVATLPHDSYTFEGLLERATRAMANDREPEPIAVMDQYPIEHRIT